MHKETNKLWVKSIWSDWADDRKISMPSITPHKQKNKLRIPNEVLDHLEIQMSSTITDHFNKKDELPLWCLGIRLREGFEILTKHYHKVLPGYIIDEMVPG